MLIKMSSSYFSENSIIERQEYNSIPFNTKVARIENCDVVIVSGSNIKRLKNLDDDVINPRKVVLFSDKIDRRNYVIYFIDKTYHDAFWGGNIQYEDGKVNGIQEQINIRSSFSYKVDRGERLIALLSENKKTYDTHYLIMKIRKKIDNAIKKYVSDLLLREGFIQSQKYIEDITKDITQYINSEILGIYGISISNMNIILEEDSEHIAQRQEISWKAYKRQMEEQNNV